MHVTLVRPPTVLPFESTLEDALPPIGLAYLASALKYANHEVVAVDAVGSGLSQWGKIEGRSDVVSHGLSIDQVVARIPENTDIIGITCMFSATWPFAHTLIDAIREKFRDTTIVVGGEHITALPEYTLNTCKSIDYAILGEGETSIVALANALEKPETTKSLFEGVPGVVGRVEGELVYGLPSKRNRAIDEINDPDWSIFPVDEYINGGFQYGLDLGRSMPIMASRGCPYRCTFCSSPKMWTTLWRARDPKNVISEMKRYVERYQATNFDFFDLTAIVKRGWVLEFSKLVIKELPGITWQLPSGTRSEAIDDETTKYMYKSGCRNIIYAPESGNKKTLALIKKKVNLESILKSMRSAQAAKLQVKANIMAGFPGETKLDLLPNLVFFVKMAWVGVEDATCFPFSPYPGSELFTQLEKEGRVKLDDDYFKSLFNYSKPSTLESYSEHMSSNFLRTYNVFCMGLFYASSYLFRPIRAWRLIRNLFVRKHPETRLEMALFRIMKRRKVLRVLKTTD